MYQSLRFILKYSPPTSCPALDYLTCSSLPFPPVYLVCVQVSRPDWSAAASFFSVCWISALTCSSTLVFLAFSSTVFVRVSPDCPPVNRPQHVKTVFDQNSVSESCNGVLNLLLQLLQKSHIIADEEKNFMFTDPDIKCIFFSKAQSHFFQRQMGNRAISSYAAECCHSASTGIILKCFPN